MLLQKSALVFFFTFFSEPNYALFKSIVLVIFSSVAFLSVVWNRPYYNQTTQTTHELFSGVFSWANWVLLFTQVIASAQFTGALEILFLGIPIIGVLVYTRQEDRNKLLLSSETQIAQAELCQKKNFYYLYIIESKEIVRQSQIILKGYVNHHSEVCPYDSCPIKAYKKQMQKDKLQNDNRKKKIQNV